MGPFTILNPSTLSDICRVAQGYILYTRGSSLKLPPLSVKIQREKIFANLKLDKVCVHYDRLVYLVLFGVLPGIISGCANQGLSFELWALIRILPHSQRHIIFTQIAQLYHNFKFINIIGNQTKKKSRRILKR